jgi:hypothetical protein
LILKGDNILYISEVGSKQLKVATVVEVIDDAQAKVQIYNKIDEGNKMKWILDEDSEVVTIERKLVFKVGLKFTKKNTINSRLLKNLSNYVF